jgi:hypothetical protein
MKLTDSFYYEETRGQCGRKLLREIGEQRRTKIRLYAYESWPKPALISHWTIKTVWWSKTKCQIIERLGHRTSLTKYVYHLSFFFLMHFAFCYMII